MRHDSCAIPVKPVHNASWLTMQAFTCGMLLLALALLPGLCAAHQLSKLECREGSDFIKNAALARDGGMNEARFIGQIRDDIEVIKGLPRELRWFVQDEEDADFLLAAAANVFREPKEALAHQSDFLVACGQQGSAQGLYF